MSDIAEWHGSKAVIQTVVRGNSCGESCTQRLFSTVIFMKNGVFWVVTPWKPQILHVIFIFAVLSTFINISLLWYFTSCTVFKQTNITLWILVRKRTMPTEWPRPDGEVCANCCGYRGVAWSAKGVPTVVHLGLLHRSRHFSFKWLLNYPHDSEFTPFQTHNSQKIWQRR
jgi:hypothetical protein